MDDLNLSDIIQTLTIAMFVFVELQSTFRM
jgi:hypothetical protein